MKKYIFILISIIFSSCLILKPRGFLTEYNGKYTGIDTLINVDGYYANLDDCPYTSLMFYRDGIFVLTNTDDIEGYFSADSTKYNPRFWGSYHIEGDVIKAQHIGDQNFGEPVEVYKMEFVIVSKNSISLILDEKSTEMGNALRKELCTLTFYPLENRIDSTNTLLKKGWFHKKKE